ncbi:peptidase S10 serine carboxypeptidase [Coniophora puteana RWD-64-598 SS2]|uniref:Carboxypeptidase n=1 Tax=Coniophora puteana (strain RWD-64-598) TaxID=741705 RepID=A0A5M3MEN4_CONPW|nr:peptidase S10 serine carboxypeptidase [Coniophora puteana RWD-64-598 SS2]EIW77065.1 peptidase S10 serine carboxypeptidase [Coniophora puteana RWD-64-598 SS2]
MVHKWSEAGKEFVHQNGVTYELVQHPHFKNYKLRVTEPTLCDASVKQYSGYLDISDSKHLFFWFFESRVSPETAPLVMWLNGGPGCSSSTGLLMELGPCAIADEGKNTTVNEHSWNTHANMVFLDQPVDVGFSYTDNGESVNNSEDAGIDVHAFMQLFLSRFPQYAALPFHVATESYGGTFAPNIAHAIHSENKKLFSQGFAPAPGLSKINLESLLIGNGMTDNYVQMASMPDYLCEGPYPIYDDPEGAQCQALRSKVPTCQRLIKACRDYNSRFTCVPAALYCNSQLYAPVQQSGLNPYDARRTCDRERDGPLCYQQLGWIETWMNQAEVKQALGVDPSRTFESCNMNVNQAFLMQGDSMHYTPALLTDLVNDGVRLLIYAGNADMMCNYMGNERWLTDMDSVFKDEFGKAVNEPWTTLRSGTKAGTVRTAGASGAGNVTFVTIHEAGHMVPFDQPEAGLDMFNRWIFNLPLNENTDAHSRLL